MHIKMPLKVGGTTRGGIAHTRARVRACVCVIRTSNTLTRKGLAKVRETYANMHVKKPLEGWRSRVVLHHNGVPTFGSILLTNAARSEAQEQLAELPLDEEHATSSDRKSKLRAIYKRARNSWQCGRTAAACTTQKQSFMQA